MSWPTTGPERPWVVQTDAAHFKGLPDYPFQPHYCDLTNPCADQSLHMHYVDEGASDAAPVLMVHGEPSWSFLYRKMIPVFAQAGYRALAPDLIGFGRSDKLTWAPHYSVEQHIDWLHEWVLQLDLTDITLICQDWGGPIGLGVLAREPQRFARVVAGNTILHTGAADMAGALEWAAHASSELETTVNTFLLDWKCYSHRAPMFEASHALPASTVRPLGEGVLEAYDAPFPSEWHKAAMRHFPLLIPVTASDPGALICQATWEVLKSWEKPFLTLFSDSDVPTRGWETVFRERVPGAANQPHQILNNAGHFWQEDCGADAAELIVEWMCGEAND